MTERLQDRLSRAFGALRPAAPNRPYTECMDISALQKAWAQQFEFVSMPGELEQ